MFGYLRPYRPYLLVKDFELYRSVYCGLCRQLGKDYGILARLGLSYDCTCYAMISMGIHGVCENVRKERCTFNPLKKCLYCTCCEKEMQMASALTVASVYFKILDNIEDTSFFLSVPLRICRVFVGHWLKKARKNYPEIVEIVSELNRSQSIIENKENPSLDECAEPTAIMLRKVMILLAENDTQKLVFGEFGYFLGKWIYLMDACDDYEKDCHHHRFNPFIAVFDKQTLTGTEKQQYMNQVLNAVTARIQSAYALMEIRTFGAITDNLVSMGLAQMQKKILFADHDRKENNYE